MQIRSHYIAVAVLAATLLTGCSSSNYVSIGIVHPAEIALSQYRRIYVGDFKNITMAPNLQDRISYQLVDALSSTARFGIVDNAVFGKFSGSDIGRLTDMIVITGTIVKFKADQEVHRGESYKSEVADSKPDKAGRKDSVVHVEFVRRVRISYDVDFKISTASDGRILGTPEVTREYTDKRTRTDDAPRPFDIDDIIRYMEADIVGEFVSKIVPTREVIQVNFLTDDDIPELKYGLSAAKTGDWKSSVEEFSDGTVNHPHLNPVTVGKAYYDLGLAYEFDHRYNEARTAISKAGTLDPSEELYGQAFSECNMRESEWRRLQEQKWE